MPAHPDVLIVGGGVIGLTTAYFLAREGVTVEVVDKGDLGQESSWAGAGIIPPGNPKLAQTPFDQLRAHSTALYPELSAELRERTGMDNGYLRCGGLEFCDDSHAADEQEWRGEGIASELLDEAAWRRLEPVAAPGLGAAYHLPDMAQVRNPRHVRALIVGCVLQHVHLRQGCPVHGFVLQGDQVRGVKTGDGLRTAGRYLIAAGAWSEGLLDGLGWRPGIRPVRGQIALLNTGMPLIRHILVRGPRYLVPRPDGRVLVGSTEENAGFVKHTTAQAIHGLIEFATSLVRELAAAQLERCWAGLRPGSPDGLPFLGPVPGTSNAFVAAGHFRAGIQLSPGTALVLKELLLGQQLTVPLEPFRLDRTSPAAFR